MHTMSHALSSLQPRPIASRISRLDTSLLGAIHSETSSADKRSLLALHAAMRKQGGFSYLEIGSHLGGSLQALIADPACERIVSVDPRPLVQPDERGVYEYPDNSTGRMRGLLSQIEGACLLKLETIESTTETLSAEELGHIDFCFIDGEHTNVAALRDARFCLKVIGAHGLLVFHDSTVVERAIRSVLDDLPWPWRAYQLPDCIFAVELGLCRLLEGPPIRRAMGPAHQVAWGWANASGAHGRLVEPAWALQKALLRARHRAATWRTAIRLTPI